VCVLEILSGVFDRMDRLPDDILIFLFRFNIYKFKDFLELRTVSKKCLRICKVLFDDFEEKDQVYSFRTMFCVKNCFVCNGIDNIKIRSVPYDVYPKRTYVYCNKFECSRNVFKTMLVEADETKKDILINEAVCRFGKVPRSDGSESDCMYLTGWMWKDSCIRCIFGDYVKDVPISKIDSKYTLKYRILKL